MLYEPSLGRSRDSLFIEGKTSDSWSGKLQKENLSTWQVEQTKKDAKGRRVAYSLLLPCITAGEVYSHPGSALLGSPWLHSVVVALGICCGFVRLWGYASASQKSHKQNSGEKKNVQKQLILLEKLLAFSYICHNFLWYFLVLWSEKLSYHAYYCCFFRVAGGTVRANRPKRSKVKITSPTCLKAFQEITG